MAKTSPIGAISRVMLFVSDVPSVAAFYRHKLGLQPLGASTPDWVELQAGGCTIALHKAGKPLRERGKALLESRGVKMGKINNVDGIAFCDGKDPKGNLFQISGRGM